MCAYVRVCVGGTNYEVNRTKRIRATGELIQCSTYNLFLFIAIAMNHLMLFILFPFTISEFEKSNYDNKRMGGAGKPINSPF